MTRHSPERVVICGAGQAGDETARRLRQLGFPGAITLIGQEPTPPYQRPPLSKKFLLDARQSTTLYLRAREGYDKDEIDLRLGVEAVRIDRSERIVSLSDGGELPYDALVLATGARARRLQVDGARLKGIHTLRSMADVELVRPALVSGARLAVVGGGFIGLEIAATARQLGVEVTIIETAEHVLTRVSAPDIGAFFRRYHERQGVRFLTSTKIIRFCGRERVNSLALTDGTTIPADIVILGVGVEPETGLARQAALTIDNGVRTDRDCRTSDPAILAIGDCASRPLPTLGGRVRRLESVHNALEGARIAAAAIVGADAPRCETPWFWSDQYSLKLQIAGLSEGYDTTTLRGDPEQDGFSLFYHRGDRLIAVDAVNRPAEFLSVKSLLMNGLSLGAELADERRSMKELMHGAREVSSAQ